MCAKVANWSGIRAQKPPPDSVGQQKDTALTSRTLRIAQIDIARTIALIAMAVFHLTFDLEAFGFIERGTMASTPWIIFARLIAGSFIFLSGMSLVIGSLDGRPDRRKVLKRLGMIGAAAVVVSIATYFSIGYAYVRFGILHHMFVASLLGLAVLGWHSIALAAVGALILTLPHILPWPLFEGTGWLWLARTTPMPPMVDYVPVLPWFGVFLFGMASAKLIHATIGWAAIADMCDAQARPIQILSWAGRHSLLVYLIHQPILFSAVFAARYFIG